MFFQKHVILSNKNVEKSRYFSIFDTISIQVFTNLKYSPCTLYTLYNQDRIYISSGTYIELNK